MMCKCHLSGTPECVLSFQNPSALQDVSFHPCVRIARFERDHVLSFVPPDGLFEVRGCARELLHARSAGSWMLLRLAALVVPGVGVGVVGRAVDDVQGEGSEAGRACVLQANGGSRVTGGGTHMHSALSPALTGSWRPLCFQVSYHAGGGKIDVMVGTKPMSGMRRTGARMHGMGAGGAGSGGKDAAPHGTCAPC